MSADFMKLIFEAIHEESVRQQIEIINKIKSPKELKKSKWKLTNKSAVTQLRPTRKSVVSYLSSFWKEENKDRIDLLVTPM